MPFESHTMIKNLQTIALFFESASFGGYSWLIIALFCLICEVFNPGLFFFLSFSAGSIGAAVMSWVGFSQTLQCLVFIKTSLITFFFLRWYFSPRTFSFEARTGVEALIGREATVLETISHLQSGRVKIRFETWPALTQGKQQFEKGEIVHVVGVKGNHVIVSH